MLEKGKFYRFVLVKKLFFLLKVFLFSQTLISYSLADVQKNIVDQLSTTETLIFDFNQKIADKEEEGNCFIKYPLLMKCSYNNLKQKTIISNGKTVAIIKKKYKKIYLYPIKSTPLSFLLQKEKIINLVKNTKPNESGSELIEFIFFDEKKNNIKIFFNKNSLNLDGWETIDAYSNKVIFKIKNLKINNQILDNFFKIPQEKDL